MSDAKRQVPSPRSLEARGLLTMIILDANTLRVFSRKWAFDHDQISTLRMIQGDLAGMVEDIKGE